jgi:hypothetical protein
MKPMKMKRYASFAEYTADQPPKNKTLINALRRFVKREAPKLEESVKWGNGCWLKEGSPVAYVYSAPDHVQFGFFSGAFLEDPKGLLRGKGAYVRHVRLTQSADLEQGAFRALLKQAIARSGG